MLAVTVLAACSGAPRVEPTPVSAPTLSRAEFQRDADSLLADPRWRSAQWGILVVDPEGADTIYSHNAGKLFIPASNQKLVTGAVALALLGGDYRFTTTFSAGGPVVGGVISGDLIVTGTGDPSVSDRMRGDAMQGVREIADSLAARGIQKITGRLVSGGNAFSDATLGFGWAWDDMDFAYSAGVDELFFNEGFTRVSVVGGARAGDSVRVHTRPALTFPAVRVIAKTAAAGTRRAVRVIQDSADVGRIIVMGEIGAGDSTAMVISFRDQALAYLSALHEALRQRGITVDSGVARAPAIGAAVATDVTPAPEPSGYALFSVMSPPLRAILPPFEKPSQNQIGEVLFKTIGRARTGCGCADSARAVVRAQLLAWGALPDGFVVRDGSGLSRHNVVSPETLARILDAMRRDRAFPDFYASLPVAGVDGTLENRMRGTPAQGNLRGKTGTLDMVRSLSGYVTTANGRQLIVVMLANNWTTPIREVEAVQDALAIRLARLRTDQGNR